MKSVFGLAAAAVLLGGALNAGAVIDLILAQPPIERLWGLTDRRALRVGDLHRASRARRCR